MHNNNKQFTGNWAVILGGSSGFGLAAAEKLARHGMNIAVLYREIATTERALKEKLSIVASENNVTITLHNINALDNTARVNFIEQFVDGKQGQVKLLLHSIARGNLKPLVKTGDLEPLTQEDIQLTTYAMATSLLDWTKDLLAAGLFNADARVIGLTSEGSDKYWDGYAAVGIAKASLESLSTYMAVELVRYGIKTNLILAGITATPSLKRIPGSDKLIEHAIARNPSGRITKPEDVANVIYLLCTDEAAWINGTIVRVDGGENCR